jgi:Nitrate and nitrite sensing
MSLSSSDAARILRFCLGADDSGSATQRADGSCAVTVALSHSSYEVLTFVGASFEETLRAAVGGGVVKAACIDKQIAFLARRPPDDEPVAPILIVSPHAAPTATPETTSRFLELTDAVAALVHETQRERGMSTLFVGSGGRLLRSDLREQRRLTDRRHQALTTLLEHAGAAPAPVRRRLERAEALLSSVNPLRAGIEDGVVTPPLVIETYSAVNAELLASIDAFMGAATLDTSRSSAIACVALLHAKEKTGIERAQLTSAFAEDRFTSSQRLAVAALIAAQSSYLHIFSTVAPRPAEQLLRRTLASPEAAEVARIESVVYGDHERDLGIDPSSWFAKITRKIDMLGDVADATISLLRENR